MALLLFLLTLNAHAADQLTPQQTLAYLQQSNACLESFTGRLATSGEKENIRAALSGHILCLKRLLDRFDNTTPAAYPSLRTLHKTPDVIDKTRQLSRQLMDYYPRVINHISDKGIHQQAKKMVALNNRLPAITLIPASPIELRR